MPVDVPLDLRRTLGIHGRGAGDPTLRFEVSGSTWRATRTPDGPVTLLVELRDGAARARAWGPGAAWVLDRLEAILGLDDDPGSARPATRCGYRGGAPGPRPADRPIRRGARGAAPRDPRAEGDRLRGKPHVPWAHRAVRRAGARRLRPTAPAGARDPRCAALPRVPPAGAGTAARGAGPGRVPGCGAAGTPGRGGGRPRGGRAGTGCRLCGPAGVPGDRAVDGRGGRDPGVRGPGRRERRRRPRPEHGGVGTRRRAARQRRADAGTARAIPGPARSRDPVTGTGGHAGTALRPPARARAGSRTSRGRRLGRDSAEPPGSSGASVSRQASPRACPTATRTRPAGPGTAWARRPPGP